MIVLFGPQGSGNHMFSKIFSLHPDVHGWKDLLDPQIEGHYFRPHSTEPSAWYWNNLDSIDISIMNGKEYAVTSISCPYMNQFMITVPPVFKFMDKLKECGIEPIPVMIGRDRNILDIQQKRIRGGPTWGLAPQLIKWLDKMPFFISTELFFLYGKFYIKSLSQQLDFPIAYDDPQIEEMQNEDSNAKYIHYADGTLADELTNYFFEKGTRREIIYPTKNKIKSKKDEG